MIKRVVFVYLLVIVCCSNGTSETHDTDNQTMFGYRFGIGGGMGISAVSLNDLTSYLNFIHVPNIDNRISEFNSAVEFFGSFDFLYHADYAAGFEYSYLLGSHTIATGFGSNFFSYSYHMPLLLGHYLVTGSDYFFKFGGGLGYFLSRYKEDHTDYTEPLIYTGAGIGGKIQAVGHTPFGDNLFGYIGLEMRFAFPGAVIDNDGNKLNDGREDVSLNFFSFGLKFGLMFYI